MLSVDEQLLPSAHVAAAGLGIEIAVSINLNGELVEGKIGASDWSTAL